IKAEGLLRSPKDAPESYGVYFGSNDTVGRDYHHEGEETWIVPMDVRPHDLHIDDIFPGRRADMMAETKGHAFKPVRVLEPYKWGTEGEPKKSVKEAGAATSLLPGG